MKNKRFILVGILAFSLIGIVAFQVSNRKTAIDPVPGSYK